MPRVPLPLSKDAVGIMTPRLPPCICSLNALPSRPSPHSPTEEIQSTSLDARLLTRT